MREINESKGLKSFTKPFSTIAIALVVGLGIGYAYQASKIAVLQDDLLDLRTKVSLLIAREQSLSADLEQAKHLAGNSSLDSNKTRKEMAELSQELSRNSEQSKAKEQRLQATIASLHAEIASANKRDDDLAKALGPKNASALNHPKGAAQSKGMSSARELALSKNEELLEKFTLVSYGSGGSAVYKHVYLENWRKIKPVSIIASLFLADITVDSAGRTHSVPFKSLNVVHGDEAMTFSSIDSLKQYFSGQEIGPEKMKCILSWDGHDYMKNPAYPTGVKYYTGNGINTVEAELDRDYAKALCETFELSESFKALSRLKGN
jgi:hypothetical protein